MRYAPVSRTAEQTPAPSVTEDVLGSLPSLPHRTFSTAITHRSNTDISPETAVLNRKQSYDCTVFTDPTPPPPSFVVTTSCVMPQPLPTPISTSHPVHEDGSAVIPHTVTSSLSDKRLSDETSAHHDVPLLPPAVFLEYLRSKRSQAPPTHVTRQVSKDPGSVPQNEVGNSHPCLGRETETNQQVREQIQIQRDALLALLGAQHAEVSRMGEEKKFTYSMFSVKGY